MPERDDLDRLLASALNTYAEPRLGLERRILARVEEAELSHAAPWQGCLGWSVAATLAASILLYFGISGVWHRQTNPTQTAPRQEQASALRMPNAEREPLRSMPSRPPKLATASIRNKRMPVANAQAAKPKLDVFPAPHPLSEEEQALLALAAQPAEVRQQVLARPAGDEAPLQISAIEISPIPLLGEGKN